MHVTQQAAPQPLMKQDASQCKTCLSCLSALGTTSLYDKQHVMPCSPETHFLLPLVSKVEKLTENSQDFLMIGFTRILFLTKAEKTPKTLRLTEVKGCFVGDAVISSHS